MLIFNHIDQQQFIQDYWQQKPCLFKNAFSNINNLVDGDELAGLACEQDIESRLITGFAIDDEWQCSQGPFIESDFADLGDKNWTLLVQGLDQWNPNVAAILKQFVFLPKWRLEDIMASYAPIGGGVGPHFDYYDVFLIQASGVREWQLGQRCDHNSPLQDNQQLKLLANFDAQQTHQCQPGDMLYIPAGLAHWGTALSDDCITLSVGFRSPSDKEILSQSLEIMLQQLSNQEQEQRYQDTSASIDAHAHKINAHALQQLPNVKQMIDSSLWESITQQAFGQLVTEPRYDTIDHTAQPSMSVEQLCALLTQNTNIKLEHATASRFAFSDTQLFVNGDCYSANQDFSVMICDKLISRPLSNDETDILIELYDQGLISISHNTD